jgi:hypothetical protein
MGLVVAAFALFEVSLPEFSKAPSYAAGLAILGGLAVMMIRTALGNAGRPEDPAPPSAMV